MKLLAGSVRLLAGAFLIGLALIKYVELRQPLAQGASIQLLGSTLSPRALVWLLVAAGAAGVLLLVLGLVTLCKGK